MRFIHLADLHIGKKVNEFSMIEDQQYILEQVIQLIDSQLAEKKRVDGVLIAGDVYDKPVPPAEAIKLLDWFLTELVGRKIPVYMVSGNHDSGERLSFGAHLLEKSGVFLKSVYDGDFQPIELKDEYGKLYLYMLPFVKPVHVKRAMQNRGESKKTDQTKKIENGETNPGQEDVDLKNSGDITDGIITYQDAVCAVLDSAKINRKERNLLIAHQMVTGASRCDSEEISIGGLNNVDAEVFDAFDYVALGHLHGPQNVGREEVRYPGTLLKYSFSERNHKKSVTLVELKEKGEVLVETVPVKPLRDMRQIEGRYEELMSKKFYGDSNREDYLKVILTDEEEIMDVLGRLRTVYPNIMRLEYNNTRTKQIQNEDQVDICEEKSPLDYFEAFYENQNNREMSGRQRDIVKHIVEKIWR